MNEQVDVDIVTSNMATASGKNFVSSSSVVDNIVDKILAEVHSGALRAGDRVHDAQLADIFGTSRTPVREALQKLREMGVVEVAANRFTRIAVVSEEEAAQQITVWAALYSALLDDVFADLSPHVIEGLRADRSIFRQSLTVGDAALMAHASGSFFLRLVAESSNAALQKSILTIANVIELAGVHFEALVGLDAIAVAMDSMIESACNSDVAGAQHAVRLLIANRSATVSLPVLHHNA